MTLIQFANAFAIAITFARWRRRSEATAVPYGANFLVVLFCSLAVSTVVFIWQCCRHCSGCVQTSSIFFLAGQTLKSAIRRKRERRPFPRECVGG